MLLRVNPFNISNNNYNEQYQLSKPSSIKYKQQQLFSQPNRTQRKLLLQRQSFLADDKNYLDHPTNMKRLTKEIERVNKEYNALRQYEDPLRDSFKRLVTRNLPSPTSSITISSSISSSSSSSSSSSISSTSSASIVSNISPAIRIHHKLLLNKLQQQ